jgi:DNA-binding NarL/FixJ family response regulator
VVEDLWSYPLAVRDLLVANLLPPTRRADPLRVLFVSQHLPVLEGLMAAVRDQPDVDIVCASATPADALSLSFEERPDVVVLGVEPPAGVGMARQLRTQIPDVAVVAFAATSNEALLLKAMDSGCSALVTNGRSITDLVVAVKTAANGDSMFPFKSLGRLLQRPKEHVNGYRVTGRELEILELLSTGESTASISDLLTLSPHTVRNHVRNLFADLGVHSRLEAVLKGHSLGLIALAVEEEPH